MSQRFRLPRVIGIVDDHRPSLVSLSGLISRQAGVRVAWSADSVAEAVKLLDQDPVDAVIFRVAESRIDDLLEAARVALKRDRPPQLIVLPQGAEVLPDLIVLGAAAARSTLTRRELEVLELVQAGLTSREIALRLEISTPTVNKHVQRLLRKLGARNRAQAIARLGRAAG